MYLFQRCWLHTFCQVLGKSLSSWQLTECLSHDTRLFSLACMYWMWEGRDELQLSISDSSLSIYFMPGWKHAKPLWTSHTSVNFKSQRMPRESVLDKETTFVNTSNSQVHLKSQERKISSLSTPEESLCYGTTREKGNVELSESCAQKVVGLIQGWLKKATHCRNQCRLWCARTS